MAETSVALRLRKNYRTAVMAICGETKSPRVSPNIPQGIPSRRLIPRLYYSHRSAGAAAHLLLNLIIVAGSAWLSARLFQISLVLALPFYFATLFLIGSRFRAFGNMLHEASHETLARHRLGNLILGHVLATLDYTSFKEYRREHYSHHRSTGDAEKDLDFKLRRSFGFEGDRSHVSLKHLFLPLSLFHFPQYFQPTFFMKADGWKVNLLRAAFYGGLLALAHFVTGYANFMIYYLVPYLTTYQVMRYWSDAFDHAGTIGSADEFYRSRNHISRHWLLNRILFPRNDEFHLVHHLFPSVPTSMQPAVHELLMQDGEYRQRDHSALGIFISYELQSVLDGAATENPGLLA